MRSISSSLALLFLLLFLSGCAAKRCGVDEEVFATFSKQKQERICEYYLHQKMEMAKLRERRKLLQAKNRQQQLRNEYLRLQALQKSAKCGRVATANFWLRGWVGYGKRGLAPLEPVRLRLAEKEALRLCMETKRGRRACFWVGLYNNHLYINFTPDYDKEEMGHYVLRNEPKTSSQTVVLPLFNILATTVYFSHDGYRFKLHIAQKRPHLRRRGRYKHPRGRFFDTRTTSP